MNIYSAVLSLNNLKETNNEPYMSNSESSLFSVASNYNRHKPLSKTELVDRYKHIIIRSVEFIFALSKCYKNTNSNIASCFLIKMNILKMSLTMTNLHLKLLLRAIYLQYFYIILLVLYKTLESKGNILGYLFMELLVIL